MLKKFFSHKTNFLFMILFPLLFFFFNSQSFSQTKSVALYCPDCIQIDVELQQGLIFVRQSSVDSIQVKVEFLYSNDTILPVEMKIKKQHLKITSKEKFLSKIFPFLRKQSPYPTFKLSLHIPQKTNYLQISTRNGSIEATDLNLDGEFMTQNGEILIKNFSGNISSLTANGNQEISIDSCRALNKITSENGNIKLQFNSQKISEIECFTWNGFISTDWEEIDPALQEKKYQFTEDAARFQLRTNNGNIYLFKK